MKIVSVCACTVGIAHTYLAQEKLERAARDIGYTIHVETQGTIGTENELSKEDIEQADIAILATDIKIKGRDRFNDMPVIQVPTEVAVKSPNKLIAKAKEVIDQKRVK